MAPRPDVAALGRAMLRDLFAEREEDEEEESLAEELERELGRKERALAEAAALLVLKKKAHAIWGDADDSIPPRSGR